MPRNVGPMVFYAGNLYELVWVTPNKEKDTSGCGQKFRLSKTPILKKSFAEFPSLCDGNEV